MLARGCDVFLASVVTTSEQLGPILAEVPIARMFGDVFLDEVLGLPPDRKVEFSIYVILGSTPLSRAPYQMALLELREFKE